MDAGHGYVNCLQGYVFESAEARRDLFDRFISEVFTNDFTEDLLNKVKDVYTVFGRHPESTKVPMLVFDRLKVR